MSKKLEIPSGKVFGNWTVIGAGSKPKYPNVQYLLCACVCGNHRVVCASALNRGKTKDCGCTRRKLMGDRVRVHGLYRTPTHFSFIAMNRRCNKPTHKEYFRYGGAGITICDRWNLKNGGSFLNFLEDMGERPEGMTLNRVNGAKVYSKETCEWDSKAMQSFDQKISKDNTSGRTGVYTNKAGGYFASITVQGKVTHLGTFSTFTLAVKAREDAEIKYYGFTKE